MTSIGVKYTSKRRTIVFKPTEGGITDSLHRGTAQINQFIIAYFTTIYEVLDNKIFMNFMKEL